MSKELYYIDLFQIGNIPFFTVFISDIQARDSSIAYYFGR